MIQRCRCALHSSEIKGERVPLGCSGRVFGCLDLRGPIFYLIDWAAFLKHLTHRHQHKTRHGSKITPRRRSSTQHHAVGENLAQVWRPSCGEGDGEEWWHIYLGNRVCSNMIRTTPSCNVKGLGASNPYSHLCSLSMQLKSWGYYSEVWPCQFEHLAPHLCHLLQKCACQPCVQPVFHGLPADCAWVTSVPVQIWQQLLCF